MSDEKPHLGDMDAIDERQQREIDSNRVWIKAMSVMVFVIFLLGIAFFIMFIRSENCPHKDCPHNTGYIAKPTYTVNVR